MELLSVGAMNRLKQLRDVRFLLREEQRQRDERSDAVGSSGNEDGGDGSGGSGSGGGGEQRRPATVDELRSVGGAIGRLSAALDQDLSALEVEIDAHSTSIARDLEAADKLDECVDKLLSAGTWAGELLSTRPYHRGMATLATGQRPELSRGGISDGGAAALAAAAAAAPVAAADS